MKAEILYNALKTPDDMRIDVLGYQSSFPVNIGEGLGEERYNALMDILHRTVVREREEEHRIDREAHDGRYMERVARPHPTAPAPGKGSGKKGKSTHRSQSGKGKGAKKGEGKDRSKSAKGNRKGRRRW